MLVNTVGSFNWNPLVDVEPEEWRRIVATNLDSVFHMCRLVVPHMRERRFGRIVNFAAVGAAATLGEPQMAAYSAAKAGVVALSRALALEEARCGITVNVVSPGLLKDESGNRAAAAADAVLGDRVPVGHPGALGRRGARRPVLRLARRRLRHRPGGRGRGRQPARSDRKPGPG